MKRSEALMGASFGVLCTAALVLFQGQSELPAGVGGNVTLTSTQVGYGSAGNAITSEAAFTYDATNDRLTAGAYRAGDGTAAQVAYGFASEANSGLKRNSAGLIAIAVGATDVVYFTSSSIVANKGIEASFGIQIATGARPACAVGVRGLVWVTRGGAGVADVWEKCTKNAADAYVWDPW